MEQTKREQLAWWWRWHKKHALAGAIVAFALVGVFVAVGRVGNLDSSSGSVVHATLDSTRYTALAKSAATPQTRQWCSLVRQSATESADGDSLEQQDQAERDAYEGGTITAKQYAGDLAKSVDELRSAILTAQKFISSPPPAIKPAFRIIETTPSNTVSVSDRKALATAKHEVVEYFAQVCNVVYSPDAWTGDIGVTKKQLGLPSS